MLTKFALENRALTIALLLICLLFGPLSLTTHPSREDPTITIRTAQVIALFPGMTATRVEDLISSELEEAIREIPEVQHIETTNTSGQSLVKITVYDKYTDMDPIWTDLRNKMRDAASDLPDGTIGPLVFDDQGNVAMATIAMTADGFSNAEIYEAAKAFRRLIYARVPGVRKVDFYGYEEQRIFVEFDNVRLARLGLDANSIVNAISSQNVILPGGRIEAEGTTFSVEPTGDFGGIDELKSLKIAVPGTGSSLFLSDIGTVNAGYEDPPSQPAFFNGKPAIVVGVSMVDQFDANAFSTALDQLTRTFEQSLPVGFVLDYVTWQQNDINAAVFSVVNNLWQTILIVLAVVIAFLGFRTGLIVGAMVPLVMLISTLLMRQYGIELERMSLAALIISLGLLVDNGIVIAEEIQGRLQRGEDRIKAALATGQGLSGPLLAASLTTIFAFLPLMLAPGGAGEYTRSISLVIAIALLVSWVVALTALILLCTTFLKGGEAADEDAAYDRWYYHIYRGMMERLVAWRYVTILVTFGTLAIGVWLMGFVSNTFFPASERAQLQLIVELPQGQNSYATRGVTAQVENWLMNEDQNPDVESVVTYIADGGPRFYLALDPPDGRPNNAYMLVTLKSAADVVPLQTRVRAYAAARVPEAEIYAKAMSMGPNEAGLVEYRISGPNGAILKQASQQLQIAMHRIQGSVNVTDDWNNPTVALNVVIDQEAARRAGLSSQDIANSLDSQLSGAEVTTYRVGDLSIPVVLRAEEEQRTTLERLASLNISVVGQSPVPLVQVAQLEGQTNFAQIRKRNLERTVTVSGKNLGMTAAEFDIALAPELDALAAGLPPLYRVEKGGEIEGSADAQTALGANVPLGFALILLVLIWQFNSFKKPVIIILTIPLVITGVAGALLIAPGANFSFMGILGFLALSGIVINNAIVLIDRIAIEEAAGRSLHEAIIESGVRRLQPIIMTTCTTAMGLMPIILSRDVLFYDLAIVIAGGLIVGTVLTLIVVPCLYAMFFRDKGPQPASGVSLNAPA
ncbi:MAG: efflux RND transporter permease subunit [Pseudomonadota bacterium]